MNLGLVPSGPRKIKSGFEFDKYFPVPENLNTTVKQGNVNDTVHLMAKYLVQDAGDTKLIAPLLKGKNLLETCENIYNFVFTYIQYELDEPGLEQLRRPSRLWHDRKGDCDCFTVFITSVLYNLNINFAIRIAGYDNNSYFQHVYPIVPIDGKDYKNGYITIDDVIHKFNYEKPTTKQKTYTMEDLGITIQYLHGVNDDNPDCLLHKVLNGVDGNESNNTDAILQHLLETRKFTINNPDAVRFSDDPKAFLKMLDYAIKYWNDPVKRDQALLILAKNEAQLNFKSGITEDDLDGISDEPQYLEGCNNVSGIDDTDYVEGYEQIEEYIDNDTINDDYLEGLTEQDNFVAVDDDDLPFDGLGRSRRCEGGTGMREGRGGCDELEDEEELGRSRRGRRRKDKRKEKRAAKRAKRARAKAARKAKAAARKAKHKNWLREQKEKASKVQDKAKDKKKSWREKLKEKAKARKELQKQKRAERRAAKKARKEQRKNAKGFFRKIGVAVKQGGNQFMKYNPAIVAARNGFLLVVRLNMFKIATRLKLGYKTNFSANSKDGMEDLTEFRNTKSKLQKIENMFVKKLAGSRVALKNAILHNRTIDGFDENDEQDYDGIMTAMGIDTNLDEGLGALDPVTEGLIIAGTPVVLYAIKVLASSGGGENVSDDFDMETDEELEYDPYDEEELEGIQEDIEDLEDEIEETLADHESELEGLGRLSRSERKAKREAARLARKKRRSDKKGKKSKRPRGKGRRPSRKKLAEMRKKRSFCKKVTNDRKNFKLCLKSERYKDSPMEKLKSKLYDGSSKSIDIEVPEKITPSALKSYAQSLFTKIGPAASKLLVDKVTKEDTSYTDTDANLVDYNPASGGNEGAVSKYVKIVKKPIVAIPLILGVSYLAIPGVRNGVNSIFGGKKQLSGITKKSVKSVKKINLK